MPLTPDQIQFLQKYMGYSEGSSGTEIEKVKDYSEGEALLRKLGGLRERITPEAERLRRVVASNRDALVRAGKRHGDALDKALVGLNGEMDTAMSTLNQLEGEVRYQHKEYLKLTARKAPSARNFAEELSAKVTPVDKLNRDTTATLQRRGREIGDIIAGADDDIKLYQERVAKDRKAWEVAVAGLEKKLDALTDLGSVEATKLQSELAENRKVAPNDYAKAKFAIGGLVLRCDGAIKAQGERMDILRAQRRNEIADRKKEMVIPSWWERLGDTWDVKQLFVKKMDQAEKLVASATNEQALLVALNLANQARDIFKDFTANKPAIEQMSEDQSAVNRVLDYYKADRPKDYAALKKRFDALEKGWSGKQPSDLAKEYAAFKIEVDGANGSWNNYRGRCESEQRWRSDFNLVATEVQDHLDALDKKIKQASPVDGAEGYQGDARTELRGLNASAATEQLEGTTTPLLKRITQLRDRVKAYVDLPNSAFSAKVEPGDDKAKAFFLDQSAGLASRKEYKEAREQVKTDHNLLIEAHKALGSKPFSDEDTREYEDIRDLINQSAKIANAKEDESDLQDLATATAMIKRANERLKLLEQGGPQIDRRKLGEMQNDWLKGVSAFKTKGEELVSAVRKAASEVPVDPAFAGAGDEVAKLAATALGFFEKLSFAAETLVLSDDAPGKKDERKRARETALSKTRQALDYLTGSAAVQVLVDNRFDVSGLGTGLFRTLRKIELEVLRGV